MNDDNNANNTGGYFKRYSSKWVLANRVYHTSYMCASQKISNGFSYYMNESGCLLNYTSLLFDLEAITGINIWHF